MKTNTEKFDFYVDAINGNDENDGTEGSPLQTLQALCKKVGDKQQ